MKRKIAQISGATLGYITNNVQGAYTGYQLAGKAYDYMDKKRVISSQNKPTMARVPKVIVSTPRGRTPKRIAYNTPRTSSRGSRSMSISRSRSRVSFSGNGISGSNNVVAKAGRKRGRAVKKEGRKKPVRVGKLFRKKVNAVFTSKGPNGHFQEIIMDETFKPRDNLQESAVLCARVFDGVSGWAFTPTYISYVNALLYNKGNFPTAPFDNVTINNTLGFEPNMQIHVKEQYYINRLKNNTARTMTVKLWDVSPKNVQEAIYSTLEFIDNETSRTARFGAPGVASQGANENPLNVDRFVIGFNPKMLSSFRKNYTLDETIITLEPGKEYIHKVKGPNDKMYKYNSFFKNGTYRNVQKFCKQTIVAFYLDLTNTGLSTEGRFTDITEISPFGLLCETTTYTTIKCPDQTGFQNKSVVVVGDIQPLTQRGYTFGIKNWANVAQAGTIFDIEDENPQAPTTQAV